MPLPMPPQRPMPAGPMQQQRPAPRGVMGQYGQQFAPKPPSPEVLGEAPPVDMIASLRESGDALPENPTDAGSTAGIPADADQGPSPLSSDAGAPPDGAKSTVSAVFDKTQSASEDDVRDLIRDTLARRRQERRERSEFFQKKASQMNDQIIESLRRK